MRLPVIAELFILLDNEDTMVRITIDDADIQYDVLGISAGEEPQLLEGANGSRTIDVIEGMKKSATAKSSIADSSGLASIRVIASSS
jgi:hypothetical protein